MGPGSVHGGRRTVRANRRHFTEESSKVLMNMRKDKRLVVKKILPSRTFFLEQVGNGKGHERDTCRGSDNLTAILLAGPLPRSPGPRRLPVEAASPFPGVALGLLTDTREAIGLSCSWKAVEGQKEGPGRACQGFGTGG